MSGDIDQVLMEFSEALRQWAGFQWKLQDKKWAEEHSIDAMGLDRPIDVAGANKLALRYARLARDLAKDEAGRVGIELLLDDEDAHVRVMAAVYVAEWDLPRACRVLEEVVNTRGLPALNATYALRRLDTTVRD